MKWLDLIHRWTGGIIGLVLAIMGLTGAILVHKDSWIALPHVSDQRIADPGLIAAEKEGWSERLKSSLVLAGPEAVDTRVKALLKQAWERS